MTPKQILLLIAAAIVVIVLPVAMVWSVVQHLRTKPSERRSGGGAGAAIGAALQELDRLVARPSVEHTVEAEKPIAKSDDDRGGE